MPFPSSLAHDTRHAIENKHTQCESTESEQLYMSKQQRNRQLAEFMMPSPWEKEERYGRNADEPSKDFKHVGVPHRRSEDDQRCTRNQAQHLFCIVGPCRSCKQPEEPFGEPRFGSNQD